MYWGLLLYVVAALVWWFISLEQQNAQMLQLRMQQIGETESGYKKMVADAQDLQRRKHIQYIGEGLTFMLLIMVGAIFVYRATRKQLRLNQLQQNFMMAVTHELKTPISVAKLNVETLLRRKLEETMQTKLLTNTLQETDRLNDLCNNILLASRMESGNEPFRKETINLNDLVAGAIERFATQQPLRKIGFDEKGTVVVQGEAMLLRLLVNNLLENALKYSPSDKPVQITLKQENNVAILQVADEGAGISAAEKRQVFKKFYRIGNEHTRTATGTGLGLYLCKKIVEAHGGKISVWDNVPAGTVFEVKLN